MSLHTFIFALLNKNVPQSLQKYYKYENIWASTSLYWSPIVSFLFLGIVLKDKRDDRSRAVAVTSGSNIHRLHKGEGSLNQPQSTLGAYKHI